MGADKLLRCCLVLESYSFESRSKMAGSKSDDWKAVIQTTYEFVMNSEEFEEKTLARVLGVFGHYRNWLNTNSGATSYYKIDVILDHWKNQKNEAEESRSALISYLENSEENQAAKSCVDMIKKLRKGKQ